MPDPITFHIDMVTREKEFNLLDNATFSDPGFLQKEVWYLVVEAVREALIQNGWPSFHTMVVVDPPINWKVKARILVVPLHNQMSEMFGIPSKEDKS